MVTPISFILVRRRAVPSSDTRSCCLLLLSAMPEEIESLRPLEAEVSETDQIPPDVVQDMREMGLISVVARQGPALAGRT
mgnify:CR=1 FL=1